MSVGWVVARYCSSQCGTTVRMTAGWRDGTPLRPLRLLRGRTLTPVARLPRSASACDVVRSWICGYHAPEYVLWVGGWLAEGRRQRAVGEQVQGMGGSRNLSGRLGCQAVRHHPPDSGGFRRKMRHTSVSLLTVHHEFPLTVTARARAPVHLSPCLDLSTQGGENRRPGASQRELSSRKTRPALPT